MKYHRQARRKERDGAQGSYGDPGQPAITVLRTARPEKHQGEKGDSTKMVHDTSARKRARELKEEAHSLIREVRVLEGIEGLKAESTARRERAKELKEEANGLHGRARLEDLSVRQVDYWKDTKRKAGRTIPGGSAPGRRVIRSSPSIWEVPGSYPEEGALQKARAMKAEALGLCTRPVDCGEGIRPLRPLRRVQRGGAPDRRTHRGAEGDVGRAPDVRPVLRPPRQFLAGKTTEAIERHGHAQLKTFGVGKDRVPAGWRGVLRQLQSARLIARDEQDRDRLVVTEEGRRVLRGEAPFALREDVLTPRPSGSSARSSSPATRTRRCFRRSRPCAARSRRPRSSRPTSSSPTGR